MTQGEAFVIAKAGKAAARLVPLDSNQAIRIPKEMSKLIIGYPGQSQAIANDHHYQSSVAFLGDVNLCDESS